MAIVVFSATDLYDTKQDFIINNTYSTSQPKWAIQAKLGIESIGNNETEVHTVGTKSSAASGHIVVLRKDPGYGYNITHYPHIDGKGSVQLSAIHPDHPLATRGEYPYCTETLTTDYCRNTNYEPGFCYSGWSDVATFVGHHASPQGEEWYGYDGWEAAYWKLYM